MKKYYDTLLYLFTFLAFQVVGGQIAASAISLCSDIEAGEQKVLTIVLASAMYSVATLVLFFSLKWCKMGIKYLNKESVVPLILCSLLALSLLIPSTYLQELFPEEWLVDRLEGIMDDLLSSPAGYIAVGLLAPIVEEVVFRGAICRRLLGWTLEKSEVTPKQCWTAICVSAFLFALIHFNPAQMPHAFAAGILLGWLYYRTGSIIPGVVYHWVNNSSAFVIASLFPHLTTTAKLPEYFNGNMTMLYFCLVGSTILSIGILYLLVNAMKKRA